MDALINKNGVETALSSIGILVTDFSDSSPVVKVNRREVTNRSGYVFNGAVHQVKTMTISGVFLVSNAYELEEKKDEINGLISNDEPFYITKMLPTQNDFYDFELPGEEAALELLSIPHKTYKYRYKVIAQSEMSYSFIGKSAAGLLNRFSVTLETAELPFGETVPIDEVVTTTINYNGTSKCSQLEWPWVMKLTANAAQSGTINVKVGSRLFTYQAVTPLKQGDTLLLKGVETTLNGVNMNDHTNYEHFILEPSSSKKIAVETNFQGTIQLLNKVELYK